VSHFEHRLAASAAQYITARSDSQLSHLLVLKIIQADELPLLTFPLLQYHSRNGSSIEEEFEQNLLQNNRGDIFQYYFHLDLNYINRSYHNLGVYFQGYDHLKSAHMLVQRLIYIREPF
jgi:hypothetical protein